MSDFFNWTVNTSGRSPEINRLKKILARKKAVAAAAGKKKRALITKMEKGKKPDEDDKKGLESIAKGRDDEVFMRAVFAFAKATLERAFRESPDRTMKKNDLIKMITSVFIAPIKHRETRRARRRKLNAEFLSGLKSQLIAEVTDDGEFLQRHQDVYVPKSKPVKVGFPPPSKLSSRPK